MIRIDQDLSPNSKAQRLSDCNLICEICVIPFNNSDNTPLILPSCGHTLCKACVKKILENFKPEFSCPLCKTTIKEDHIDISYFPKNYSLAREIDLVQKDACKDHQKYLDMFCMDCEQKICNKCYHKGTHREHNCEYVEDLIIETEIQFSDLKDMVTLAETHETTINRLVEARKQALKWMIRDKYTKLIKHIERHMKEALKILDNSIEKLEIRSLFKIESPELKDNALLDVVEWKNHVKNIEEDWKKNQSLLALSNLKTSQHSKYRSDVLKWVCQDHREKAKKILESISLNFNDDLKTNLNTFFQIKIEQKDKPFELNEGPFHDKLKSMLEESFESKRIFAIDSEGLYDSMNILKFKTSDIQSMNEEVFHMYMFLFWNLERFSHDKISLQMKNSSLTDSETSTLMCGVNSILKPNVIEADFSYSVSMERCLTEFSHCLLMSSNLQSLSLDFSGSMTNLNSLKTFVFATQNLRSLKKLTLDFSNCKTVSNRDFVLLLKGIARMKSLTSFVFSISSCNNFDINCYTELSDLVASFDKEKFKRLDLELGPMDKNLPKEVLDKLFEEIGKIAKLSMFGLVVKSRLLDENMKSLTDLLKKLKSLKTLNIDLQPNANFQGTFMMPLTMMSNLKLMALTISNFNINKPELFDIIIRSVLFLNHLAEIYVLIPELRVPNAHLLNLEKIVVLSELSVLSLSFEMEYAGLENLKKACKAISVMNKLKQINLSIKVIDPKQPISEISPMISSLFSNNGNDINFIA